MKRLLKLKRVRKFKARVLVFILVGTFVVFFDFPREYYRYGIISAMIWMLVEFYRDYKDLDE